MNHFSANYAPNTAVTEYQAALNATPTSMVYTAEGKYTTEEEAKSGLAIGTTFGKWQAAKKAIGHPDPDLKSPAEWDAVRWRFLELGGLWLDQAPEAVLNKYSLADCTPDWLRLLDIEKPQVWSTASLTTACHHLRTTLAPSGRQAQQLERFEAVLAARA